MMMLPLGFALTLLGPAAETVSAPFLASEEASVDLVLRTYEVGSIDLDREGDRSAFEFHALPLIQGKRLERRSEDTYSMPDGRGNPDPVVSLIENLYEEEFLQPGRHLDTLDSGQILVRAPQSVHDGIATLLDFLRELSDSCVEIEVDAVTLPAGSSWPLPEGSISTAQQAAGALSKLPGEARHERFVLRMPAHESGFVDHSVEKPILVGVASEIAQMSATGDPVVNVTNVGTRLIGQASLATGGVELALALRRSETVADSYHDEVMTRETAVGDRVDALPALDIRHAFAVEARQQLLHAFLAEGEALWIRNSYEDVDEVLILRRGKGDLRSHHELVLGARGARLRVTDLSPLDRMRFQGESVFGRRPGRAYLEGRALKEFESAGHAWPVFLSASGGTWFAELVDLDSASFHGSEGWMFDWPKSWAAEDEEALAREVKEHAQAAAMYDELLGASRSRRVQLELRLVVDGEVLAESSSPCLANAPNFVVLGREQLTAIDYEVEVAQGANISTVNIQQIFQGLALWCVPHVDGAPRVELSGAVQVIGGGQTLDFGGGYPDEIEMLERRRLVVGETLQLSASEGRGWSGLLGLVSDGEGIQLEVSLEPLD